MRLVGNRLVVEYEPDTNPIYRDVAEAVAIVAAELGTTVSKPGTPTTAHPMGGACLADSPRSRRRQPWGARFSATRGAVRHRRAALPQPVGGPPSLTIGAWAEHVAERFIEKNAPADRRGVPVGKKSIPTQTAMDGWWGRHVVTRVVRDGCRRPALMSARDELLAHAHGAVFELGCGDGINIPLLDEPRITSYTAIDPSDELLLRARDVAAGHRIPADIRWGVGEDVPFPDASFDTVITSYALCSVRSPPHEVLREMRRILRPPDGWCCTSNTDSRPIGRYDGGSAESTRSPRDSWATATCLARFRTASGTPASPSSAWARPMPMACRVSPDGWSGGVARPAPKVEPEEREGTGQPQLRDLGLRAEP